MCFFYIARFVGTKALLPEGSKDPWSQGSGRMNLGLLSNALFQWVTNDTYNQCVHLMNFVETKLGAQFSKI